MIRLSRALIGAALLLASSPAQAQNNYPSVGGATVPTSVAMCLNSSGQAVPLFNAAGTWQCSGATLPVSASFSGTGANNADAVASVGTGLVSDVSYLFGYNGTTWDRLRADTTSGLWTQVKAALPAGTAIIGKVGIDQTTPGTTNLVTAGQNGTWTVQPGNTPNTTPWLTTDTPSAASGAAVTSASSTAAASNLVLKASAGNLYSLTITIGATSGYAMLFDATSLPSNGAVTPVWCYPITSNGTNGGIAIEFATPKPFATGITAGFSTTGCFTLTASATGNFFGGYK